MWLTEMIPFYTEGININPDITLCGWLRRYYLIPFYIDGIIINLGITVCTWLRRYHLIPFYIDGIIINLGITLCAWLRRYHLIPFYIDGIIINLGITLCAWLGSKLQLANWKTGNRMRPKVNTQGSELALERRHTRKNNKDLSRLR